MYRLKKALCGLKQAPRAWNKCIDKFLDEIRFVKCITKYGAYVKTRQNNTRCEKVIICLYVSDLLIIGSNKDLISNCKAELLKEFEMSNLGSLSYFLGIKFKSTPFGMIMHQSKHTHDLLTKFSMQQGNFANTPANVRLKLENDSDEERVDPTLYQSIVGSLRYLCNTKPNLNFSLGWVIFDSYKKSILMQLNYMMICKNLQMNLRMKQKINKRLGNNYNKTGQFHYFQYRFFIGYLKIIVKIIIIVDLQINQCKVSVHLLAFSLLIKVQSQLKVRIFRLFTVNSIKVQYQLNFTMSNHVYSFVSSPNRKLN